MKKVKIEMILDYDHAQEVGKLIAAFPEAKAIVEVIDDNYPTYKFSVKKTKDGYKAVSNKTTL